MMQGAVGEHICLISINHTILGNVLRILNKVSGMVESIMTFVGRLCEVLHNLR